MAKQGLDANELAHQLLDQKTSLTPQDIRDGVQQKKQKYDNLLDKPAAVIIYAKEDHGINLVKKQPIDLKLENLVPGLQNIDITVTVDHIFDTNHFDGGKVRNIVIKDNTADTQLSLWNEDVEAGDGLKPGDTIRIKGGYTKSEISDYQNDNYGLPSINVGEDGEISVTDE